MKKLLLFFIASTMGVVGMAQIPVYDTGVINVNAVSALYTADGTQNFKGGANLPAYFVPQDSLQASIYCAALWVGGLDAQSKLHLAAQTYHQNGTDFWPGPVMDSIYFSPHEDTVWDHVWVVYKSTIDSFREGKFHSSIPASIQNWPGNGDTSLGEMATLAPYVDSDNNGMYDPAGGDYPLIRGDEAAYTIFNDLRGTHTEARGKKLGIEVHLMAYQFKSTDTAINEATFLHYDIYNLSTNDYDSIYFGNWIDMDVGNGGDNYIGCDSANNYWYTYCGHIFNSDGGGEVGYHSLPPAQSLVYLCDTMTHFMYYNNDASVRGNPENTKWYYYYLKNKWGDNTHTTYGGDGYGGSSSTNYVYSGNPLTGTGWSEVSAGNISGDRRGLSSAGPHALLAKHRRSLDLALVFAQSFPGNNLGSVALLDPYTTRVKEFYNSQSYGCDESLLSVPKINNLNAGTKSILVYPDPATNEVTFKMSSGDNKYITIYDITGREMQTQYITYNEVQINTSAYSPGIYLYKVFNESNATVYTGRFSVAK